MKTVYCFLFSFCLVTATSAQRVYFVYLESDKGVPFYVKVGDKIHTSATSGYLILSNLVDSSYNFLIGYPSTKSESKFFVKISGKDRGFLIKDFDYGPGLFDMQTTSVIKPEIDESQKNISYRARNDEFTTLLAKASNDSSLLFVPVVSRQDVVQTNEKKKETEQPVVETKTIKPDTTVSVSSQAVVITEEKNSDISSGKKDEIKPPVEVSVAKQDQGKSADESIAKADEKTLVISPASPPEEYKRSTVRKHSESSTSEGFGLVFYDKYEGGTDTIQLIIPNPKITFNPNENADTVLTTQSAVQAESKQVEVKKDTLQQVPIVVAVKDSRNGIIVNSHCKSIAAENDFFKLRKNMASKTSDDTMVDEAKKVFKNKCFSTEQIKNLGSLFLTSAGKYQFFDAAYLHVTDRERFSSLQSEISDEYYLKRFKALVGE